MPRVPRYTIDALRDLDRQLSYAPVATRKRHLDATERLIADLEPDRNYPEDFIIFRITGYRSEIRDPATFVGRALIRDLSSLITSLSDGLGLPTDPGRPALTIEDAAERLGVSMKTIHRYRRQGLICHYLIQDGDRKRLSCYVDQLDDFASRHAGRTAKARGFTRLDDDAIRRIVDEARKLRARDGVSLNEAARRLAAQYGRAHETIRLLLRRHDEASGEPIFGAAGPLTDRKIRLIARAYRWDVPAARLAARFGKTRPTIHRAVNQVRADLLRALDLNWIDLPTFALDDADDVILTPPVVTSGLADPPESSHAITLIKWAHEDRATNDQDEDALVAAYNALKRRAAMGIDRLGDRPGSDALDRIETDLRWAGLVKRKLVFIGLPAAIVAVERVLGKGLHTQPTDAIVTMLARAFDWAGRAVEQVDPARHQRVARLSAYLMDRAMAARAVPDLRARAGARHVEGTIPLFGLAASTIRWHEVVDLPERWRGFVDRLDDPSRRIVERRYGVDGQQPLAISELCGVLEMNRLAMLNRLTKARRALRRFATE